MGKGLKKEKYKLAYEHPESGELKLYHCLVGKNYPTEKFLSKLGKRPTQDLLKLPTLLKQFIKKGGRLAQKTKYKYLLTHKGVKIFEIKQNQIRLACFSIEENKVGLIYGLVKKRDDWSKKDINSLKENISDHLDA